MNKKKGKMKRAKLPKRKQLESCSWDRSEFVEVPAEVPVEVEQLSGTHSPVKKKICSYFPVVVFLF